MRSLIQLLFGPVIYRPHQPNLLETSGNKMLSVGAAIYNACVLCSPIVVPYIAIFWSHNHFTLLRAVLMFYAAAFSIRAMGRLTNSDYMRFIKLLEEARNSPQNVTLRDQLKNYDFQMNYNFQVFDAPVDFKASPRPTASMWHATPERLPPINLLVQAVAWTAAHTFGRRMLFPGSMALFNALLNSQLLDGRQNLLNEMGGRRNIIETEEGNKVDSVFIDKRGSGDCGDILIICCEGNAGYYEMGIMTTPAKLKYSVLGWNLPGFAESTGIPWPHTILSSMEAVMQFAVNSLGFQPQQIVLFGWSIGGFPATWAAANYRQIKALILDASFDDLLPLAKSRMPSGLEELVRFTVRTHLDLPIAKQLDRYEGPVLLIRRWNDEIIVTDSLAVDESTRRASNRINHLLISLLRSRHPDLLRTAADEECVLEWLAWDPNTRRGVDYLPADDGRTVAVHLERQKLIRQLCNKYFVDFMDATHNVPLAEGLFRIPTSP